MATSTYSSPVSEVFGNSVDTATSLATGDILNVRSGFRGLQLYCSSAFKFLTTPRIDKVWLYDISADVWSDFTSAVLDNLTTTGANLGTMATTDVFYVGCVDTYLGLDVTMGSPVNAVVATFTEEYWNGDVWTQLPDTISDGTLNGGNKTLAQTGIYTWGIPGAGLWKPSQVNGSEYLYYTRYYPSAALTAGTTITGLVSVNKGTSYIYLPGGMTHEFNYDENIVGGLQFLAVAGTPTVYANWIRYKG